MRKYILHLFAIRSDAKSQCKFNIVKIDFNQRKIYSPLSVLKNKQQTKSRLKFISLSECHN